MVVITDNGTHFTSLEFKQFLKNNNIKHFLTFPNHPETSGWFERPHRTMNDAMRRLLSAGCELSEAFYKAIFYHNVLPIDNIPFLTPHTLWYGRCPSFPWEDNKLPDNLADILQFLKEQCLEETFEVVQERKSISLSLYLQIWRERRERIAKLLASRMRELPLLRKGDKVLRWRGKEPLGKFECGWKDGFVVVEVGGMDEDAVVVEDVEKGKKFLDHRGNLLLDSSFPRVDDEGQEALDVVVQVEDSAESVGSDSERDAGAPKPYVNRYGRTIRPPARFL